MGAFAAVILVAATAAMPAADLVIKDVEVIHDSGRTLPVSAVVEGYAVINSTAIEMDEAKVRADIEAAAMSPGALQQELSSRVFPVKTTGLRAVTLPGRHLSKPIEGMEGAMFVISDDAANIEWAVANKAEFGEWGAVGVLVNCKDEATYREIKARLSPLNILPLNGDFLVQIGTPGYPVMVTSEGFFQ